MTHREFNTTPQHVDAVVPTPPQFAPSVLQASMQVAPPATRTERLGSYRRQAPPFRFDGGAGTYVGTGILAAIVTIVTLGISFPFALVLVERWKAKHTYIEGRRLIFTGTATGLFGNWLKWLLLMFATLGVYSFWVVPRVTKWRIEHLAFDPTFHASANGRAVTTPRKPS